MPCAFLIELYLLPKKRTTHALVRFKRNNEPHPSVRKTIESNHKNDTQKRGETTGNDRGRRVTNICEHTTRTANGGRQRRGAPRGGEKCKCKGKGNKDVGNNEAPTVSSQSANTSFQGLGPPRPRLPWPLPRYPPRPSPPLMPCPGPPPLGLLTGLSPRSFLVSKVIRGVPSISSTLTPPWPPWFCGSEVVMARLADSTFSNSRKAHALLRTISSSLTGPKREVTFLSALSVIVSTTPYK